MSDSRRNKLLVELEAELRRTETALAVAQGDYEKAYTALWEYTSEHSGGPPREIRLSPEITMH
jgi:hypothetical protein